MDESFSIFNIAFPWFSVISFVICCSVGVIVSHFTGGYDISRTGTKLISPVAHGLVPKEIRDVELQQLKSRGPISPEEDAQTHWTWSSPEEVEHQEGKLA